VTPPATATRTEAAFVTEGATRVFAHAANAEAGPGRRVKGLPFYNPGMALNRDLSVLIAAAEVHRRASEGIAHPLALADALCGTGARALRWANEVEGSLSVAANDASAAAIAAVQQGVRANAVAEGRLSARQGEAHAFLAGGRFDVVDLDPHGSPMPFLDAAVRAVRPGGLLCVTATDTGALAGTFPRVCRRRYDAHHGLHAAPWKTEVGLRILAGAVVRSAARFERAATPVLSVCHGHWMRVVARLDGARQDADAALARLSAAIEDEATGSGRFVRMDEAPAAASRRGAWAGPLWSGPLHDAAFVARLRQAAAGRTVARPRDVEGLLPMLAAEAQAAAFWVFPDGLQATLGPPPKRDMLLSRLAAAGHAAARTHMDPQGIRTDADRAALAAEWGRGTQDARPEGDAAGEPAATSPALKGKHQ